MKYLIPRSAARDLDGPDGGAWVRRGQRTTPATQAAHPGQRWPTRDLSRCYWQAVVAKQSNTTVPGKEYLLDWRCQVSCPCRSLAARSRALVLTCVLAPSRAAGGLID